MYIGAISYRLKRRKQTFLASDCQFLDPIHAIQCANRLKYIYDTVVCICLIRKGRVYRRKKCVLMFDVCMYLLGGKTNKKSLTHARRVGKKGTSSINVCVCVFFPFILDIKFVGRTSRGHTGGRSQQRISHPPSFCGACLNFSREKDSAIPFPRRP